MGSSPTFGGVRRTPLDAMAGLPVWADAVSKWCYATRGDISLDVAFAALLAATGAEAGMIVRGRLPDGPKHPIARCDWRDGQANPLKASFADQIFGQHLNYARKSSCWVQSSYDPIDAGPISEFQQSRNLQDFAALILSISSLERDHIELHFRHVLTPAEQDALGGTLDVLARSWTEHQIGITPKVVDHSSMLKLRATSKSVNVLDITNPLALTKAEFRVCHELARGLSIHGVCGSLNLTESTVRSHLRNIYAKSDTSNLAELVFLLMDGGRGKVAMQKRLSA